MTRLGFAMPSAAAFGARAHRRAVLTYETSAIARKSIVSSARRSDQGGAGSGALSRRRSSVAEASAVRARARRLERFHGGRSGDEGGQRKCCPDRLQAGFRMVV